MKYLLILILLCPLVLLADDDENCRGHSCNDGDTINPVTNVSTEVQNATSLNSRGYSVSGGDMYIRDCLATHAVLFGLWQGTHVNKLCEADRLNRDGRYQAAAEMKCSIRSVRKVYGENCIEAVKLSAPPAPAPVVEVEDEDEDDRLFELQMEYDARIQALEERLAQRASSTRTVIKEKEWMTDEKRAKLEAVLAE